jgi:tetratricopeptide (TPR) repeat protein/predicted Ser/Thr protein kinase
MHASPPFAGLRQGASMSMDEPKRDWSEMETRVGETSAAVRSSSSPSGAGMFPVPLLSAGTVLAGRYEVLAILGEGGMGAVYKVLDRELDRMVALKTIRPELAGNSDMLRRFKQELILARQIAHRNIVRLYDISDGSGVKFITMEFVDGEDFHTLLRRQGKLSADEAVHVMRQICLALDAAHTEGVIHRDLKPQNIMRDKQGRIVVMDFGLARALESGGMTRTGALVGTMEYMSPEQAKGEAVGPTSDIYAAGLIFYELLTGKMPYQAESALASLMKRAQQRALPVSEVDKSIPRNLSAIVSRCIEPDHRNRYQSAAELMADLEIFQPSGVRTSTTTVIIRRPPMLGLYRWVAIAVVVLVVAAAGLVGWKKFGSLPEAKHAPVSILISDFQNATQEPVFDGTLEPAFTVAMEGAPFISSYSRAQAHTLAAKLQPGASALNPQLAHLVATREGIGVVVTGSIARDGDSYRVSVKAEDGITGTVIADISEQSAKNDVLGAMGKLASKVRQALGDTTPESVQLAAAETFTAGSLEAAHEYAQAQQLQWLGKWDEALPHYTRAAELDPNMGRAYSGMAALFANTGHRADAEKYYKMALAHLDRMTERERFRTRGGYYLMMREPQRAIEEYSALVKAYPGDESAWGNLALSYFYSRDMAKALEEGRRAVELYPKNLLLRGNLALYADYAGDYATAAKEARTVLSGNPGYVDAYGALAMAEIGAGQVPEAVETYNKVAGVSARGASIASVGLADLAMFEGRTADAIGALQKGLVADLARKDSAGAAQKSILLAEALLAKGDKAQALAAADRAVAWESGPVILFSAARLHVEAGEFSKSQAWISQLEAKIEPEPQVYGKLLRGEMALQRGDTKAALAAFDSAQKISDTWLGHYDLGRAYLAASSFPEAQSQFEICLKRRGEAGAIFLDDVPTFRALPLVYYYMGRAQEGLNSPAAVDFYKTFLAIKKSGDEQQLVADARRRIGSR